jgi:hypothetical protein
MIRLNHRQLSIRIIELVLFKWKQENRNINILQTKSCDNLADLFTKSLPCSTFRKYVKVVVMRRLKWLQESGGEILRDIWPVLSIILHSFLCMSFAFKVFSSKVFNEVISTKLYASSLFFPTGFLYMMITSIFPFGVQVRFSHYPKDIVYSLFFPQGFFEEIKYWMTACRWSNGARTPWRRPWEMDG